MDEDNKKRTCQGDDVYRQTEDAVLKTVMQYFKDELLPYWGFQEKAVGIAPTELVYLEMQKLFQDFNLIMEDGSWSHFEFQSKNEGLEGLKRLVLCQEKVQVKCAQFPRSCRPGQPARAATDSAIVVRYSASY